MAAHVALLEITKPSTATTNNIYHAPIFSVKSTCKIGGLSQKQ